MIDGSIMHDRSTLRAMGKNDDAGKLARVGLAEKKRLAAKGRAAISIVQRARRDIEKSYFAMGREAPSP